MKNVFILLFLLTAIITKAQQVLPIVERAEVIDDILAERFNNLLPELMDTAQIDMWVVISREYNEDPVLRNMLP
ncbi:MAG: Xaa-Pro aminopeptidase, partial [Eudoraea sp.]